MSRDGVTPDVAKAKIRRDTTLIGIMLLRRGDADAMVCGTFGTYDYHLKQVADVIGLAPGAKHFAAMNLLLLTKRMLVVTDTYVNENPSAEEVAEIARMAADELRRFGIEPNVALLSHSNSAVPTRRRRARCGVRARSCTRPAPTSTSTARCTVTPRCRWRCATSCIRTRASRARPICW
jgi:Phosphotransacetylase